MKFGVIGSGSWGTAQVKILTDNGHDVIWCVRSEKMIEHIKSRHHNPKYLSSVYFDLKQLALTTEPSFVYQQAEAIVFAVPSAYATSYLDPYKELLKGKVVVSAIKGILPEYNLLFNDYLIDHDHIQVKGYVTLMGPCHAEEVAAEKLSYLTFSSTDLAMAEKVAECFKTPFINTIVNNDVYGVQYASIMKNIYALGAGILFGLGYGDNFMSVFVANASGEMQSFLRKVAKVKNMSGTCDANYASSVYMGDLLVTCYSLFSRNRSFGNMIGKGYSVESTKLSMQMVAEGYPASKSIHSLNQEVKVEMPIANAIYDILWEGKDPGVAFRELEASLV